MPRTLVRATGHDRDRSLGWLANAWIEALVVHGPGDVQEQPVRHTDEYAGFVVDCYAHGVDGRRLYDSAFLSRPKGCDKSGMAARFALYEALGPCRFAGWAEGGEIYRDPWGLGFEHIYLPGEPMGRPVQSPFIRCLATEEGQPLALDTPVPTVAGWTTVGKLRVGDEVFGSDGRPVAVARTTRVFEGLDCYRVTFSDGEQIVASGSHQWTVDNHDLHSGKHTRVTVTTEAMSRDFRSSRGNAYRLPLTPAFEVPERDLCVDPYFLGLWLGDGSKREPKIAFDWRLRDEYEAILTPLLQAHEVLVWSHETGNGGVVRVRRRDGLCPYGHDFTNDLNPHLPHRGCGQCCRERNAKRGAVPAGSRQETMKTRLRMIGVLGSKHIPADYMWASVPQRMALLQGLMDSDGHVNHTKGRACFTNADRRLIDDVERLLTSLGYKWDEQHCTNQHSGAWRVLFQPTTEQPVARLRHKVEAHRPASSRPRSTVRHVVDVQAVASVPVKCIGIDNADHLFAAGQRAVLTHNTGLVYDTIFVNLTKGPLSQAMPRKDNAGLTRTILPNGGEIRPSTASSSSKDGGKETFACFDESHLYNQPQLRSMYNTVTRNLPKRAKIAETWFLETTTMFAPGEDSVAEETYKLAEQIVEGKTKRERLLLDHRWGVVEDMSDEDELADAVTEAYGDALAWNHLPAIIDKILDPRVDPSDSMRYYLNDRSSAADAWLSSPEWAGCLPKEPVVPLTKTDAIVLGFDGSRKRSRGVTDATALIGCRVRDGFLFEIEVWEQPHGVAGETWQVPDRLVDARVRQSFKDWHVVGMYADPAKWETYVSTWEADFTSKLKVKVTRDHPMEWWMTGGRATYTVRALEQFANAVHDRELTHDGSSTLSRHVLNARRRETRSGIQIAKETPSSDRKIDAAVAAVLAWQARLDALAAGITDRASAVPRRIR